MTVLGATDNSNSIVKNFVAPDGGWGWIIVLSSFLIHLIMDGITYSLGTYLTLFTEVFHVSHGAASIIHSLLPAVTLLCGPIASMFTNRYGCRATTIIGAIIATIGFLASVFCKKFYMLYITIGVVAGIGFGLIYVPAIVAVGYYFEKRRSLAIGIAVCGSGVGTFILAPLNEFFINKYGWQGAFLIKSGIILNTIVCGIVMRPVPIEPSELLRAKRKQEKLRRSGNGHLKDQPLLEKPPPQIIVSDYNDSGYNNNDTNNNIKIIGESMPNVYGKVRKGSITATAAATANNYEHEQHKNGAAPVNLNVEVDQMAKSMPTLQKMVNSKNNLALQQHRRDVIPEMQQLKKQYSSMDIMAHVRSSQNISIVRRKSELAAEEPRGELLEESATEADSGCAAIIDLSIFKDVVFICFAVSNFLTSLGFNAPFIYIVDQAMKSGIKQDDASWLLGTIGISNTVGRIILGFVSDLKSVNKLYLYGILLTICGVATMIEPFFNYYTAYMIYSVVFGFTSGGYVSLTSVLIVDLLGLEKLTNAFGICLVFQGVATAMGPPVVGAMYDFTKSYLYSFIFIGVVIALSGLVCIVIIPFLPAYKRRRQQFDK